MKNLKVAATYTDVMAAINERRLFVDPDTSVILTNKRIQRAPRWRAPTLELVHGPHQKLGYHRVGFSFSGGPRRCLAHRVVWYALRGDIPKGLVINHLNGDKLDNRLENLELVTYTGNIQHAMQTGLLDTRKPKNWTLTADTVREIRLRHRRGTSQADLARSYKLTPNLVCRLVNRKTYESVT